MWRNQMVVARGTILGKLVSLLAYETDDCIPNTKTELYKDISEEIGVQIPGAAGETFLSIGTTPPEDETRLWIQTAVDGFPLSFNKWNGVSWQIIYGIGYNYPQDYVGNTNNPPSGWRYANGTNGTPNLTALTRDLPDGTKYFKIVYTGENIN